MKEVIKFLIIIFFSPGFVFAQGEFNNWYFGNYAGVTFNSGHPVAIMNNIGQSLTTSVTVSDSLGNLLFYSSSQNVYDKNNNIMPNSNNLLFDGYQPILSIKSLVDDSLYYLFTIGMPSFPVTRGLFYSVIDLRLRGGLGDIVPSLKK